MKNEIRIGQVLNYTYPGMKLISGGGTAKGKFIRFSKSGKHILVEDTEIQQGERKIYQHWIGKDQIIKS